MSIRISVAANDDCNRVSISIFPTDPKTDDGPQPHTNQLQPLTPRYEAIGDLPEVATTESLALNELESQPAAKSPGSRQWAPQRLANLVGAHLSAIIFCGILALYMQYNHAGKEVTKKTCVDAFDIIYQNSITVCEAKIAPEFRHGNQELKWIEIGTILFIAAALQQSMWWLYGPLTALVHSLEANMKNGGEQGQPDET